MKKHIKTAITAKGEPHAEQSSGRSFRLACAENDAPLVESLLLAEGYEFTPARHYNLARRLVGGPRPLGSSLAARFGYIYIQDASSMLPALALAPPQGAAILDMCASPGGKTSLLSLLAGQSGFVIGNEPSPKRLGTLRHNLEAQNLLNSATCSYPGEEIPDFAEAWGHILLDPPCSGWGTVEKHPKVLSLWQGDKVKPLLGLQRLLLRRAADMLAPGGSLVYSTCTTNVEENEEQVLWAAAELGLELLPMHPPSGFTLAPPAHSSCAGVWRVEGADEDFGQAQGFFVALLRKKTDAPYSREELKDFFPLEQTISRKAIDGTCQDSKLLPPGKVAVFGDAAYFIPETALKIIPAGFNWRGFSLGKIRPGAPLKTRQSLRALMPRPGDDAFQPKFALNFDETAPIRALLEGRSLPVQGGATELGLYFRGLPLRRLQARGGRVFLAA